MKKIIIIIAILISLPGLAADIEWGMPVKFTVNRIKEFKKVPQGNGIFNEVDTRRTIQLDPAILNMCATLRQSFAIDSAASRSLPKLESEYFNKLELYKPIFESPELLA